MKHNHSPFKKRLSEWTNPKIIAVAILLQLIGLPMVLWLMSYKSDAAVSMFVITWLSLTTFVLYMVRRAELDPRHYIDGKVLERTKQEINDSRIAVRRELVGNEIAALRKGKLSPVLDVWRLDPALRKRHPYFAKAVAVAIDPARRELLIRVQLEAIPVTEVERKAFCTSMMTDMVSYIGLISVDSYLRMMTTFFDTVIIQTDSMREDEHHADVPFPILIIRLSARKLWQCATIPFLDARTLGEAAEIRFAQGREVEPYRTIDIPFQRGLQ